MQFVSASLYSLGHGGNGAQKTMGIIAAFLAVHGRLPGAFHIPIWVVITCNAAMAPGTLFGGWKIVRIMGSRISTTQTITGAIVGVGAAKRASAVRWGVAQDILIAWLITMPAAAAAGAAFFVLAEWTGRLVA